MQTKCQPRGEIKKDPLVTVELLTHYISFVNNGLKVL